MDLAARADDAFNAGLMVRLLPPEMIPDWRESLNPKDPLPNHCRG